MRRLTQTDLAELVGVKQPHISRIEAGDDGPPLRLFKDIAAALNVSLADLFSEPRATIERLLVDAYRQSSPDVQRQWTAMARAAMEPPPASPENPPIDPGSSAR